MPSVLDLFSGIILAAPFVLLWIISGGKWIGFGDAKLALGIGWFLGMVYGLSAIIIGFWIGAVISLILLGAGKTACSKAIRSLPAYFGLKHVSMKSEIPFAPFLILGLVLVYFFKWDVTGLGTLLAIMP
jgi:prepilin signal peptidase PulO-like enzyme (type II secretory pathway)